MRAIPLRLLPKHTTAPQGGTAPVLTVVVAVSMMVAVVAAVVAGVPSAAGSVVAMASGSPFVLAGVAVGGLLAVLAALYVPVRRSRRKRARTAAALSWIEALHVCGGRAAGQGGLVPSGGRPSDDVALRVLQAQVRTLEAALDEQQHRTTELQRTRERELLEARERALLTVRAMRDVVAEQPGVVAANRIEAALARIGTERRFVRPTLAASPTGAPVVALAAPQPAPTHEEPATPPAPAPVATEEASSAAQGRPEPSVAEPEVVLPVPVPPTPASRPRTRRRLRRPVAA